MMKRKENVLSWAHLLIVVLLLGLLVSACVSASLGEDQSGAGSEDIDLHDAVGLTAELSVPETIPLCAPVKVNFTVTNEGNQAVYLLTWYTPLEGVLGNIFKVTFQGKELAYQGPMVMRAAPLAEQYVRLGAGETETAVVDLSRAYDFTRPGEYTIAYRSPFISHVVRDETEFAESVDELGPVEIPSSPLTVEITSSQEDGGCGRGESAAPGSQAAPGEVVVDIQGVVMDVSRSARLIILQEKVHGFSTVVLLEEARILTEDGTALSLEDLENGMLIRAIGRPGEKDALLAERVEVLD